ncbi:SUMF1/EgtB/PvdO family nonheme iron enzyme [Caenimonas terrae]|uniref:SUMF1/EgtB/PvdO family nonheme iron enzyme n=1 Tax=Caenimonas terrae TaxID=696074 RepID=A0ABW0N9W5_9BURK
MDATFHVYSKAQALRTAGTGPVREALLEVRRRTLALADAYFLALADAGMQVPYASQLNPPLWEMGHVAWFQEYWIERNRQRPLGVKCNPDHRRFPSSLQEADALYDSGKVEHRSRWSLPLPDFAATRRYLDSTLQQTLVLLDQLPEDASEDELYFFRLVALHEAMHGEAAAYMGEALGIGLPPHGAPPAQRPALTRIALPQQHFKVGSPLEGFAFDNELLDHHVPLAAFQIDSQPVSWARFMPFVKAGGCKPRPGWAEAAARDPSAPAVHLSAAEAEGWCRWAGRRLPTEAEWECAAIQAPGFSWGEVWEWTASTFEPYPEFAPHPYRDYSQPWFGSRRVLRGAAAATSPWLAHPRYRNFFEPQRSDIFAGFRSCA